MKAYLELLEYVMRKGSDRLDRTGVGTRGVFGYQFRHDLSDGFPLLTTKKVFWKGVVHELLWFLRGDTNVRYLQENGVHIWDEWADERGDLGPVYGKQWRRWVGHSADGGIAIDQVADLVAGLKSNPWSRRHIVSAWNPADVPHMALPPCHTLWQCHVQETSYVNLLNLHLYARSIDSFLGLPFNIASYALLLTVLASLTGMVPGQLIISFGDLHIYRNHFDQVREQLRRTPRTLPMLTIVNERVKVEEFVFEDFSLLGYAPDAAIAAPVAVGQLNRKSESEGAKPLQPPSGAGAP